MGTAPLDAWTAFFAAQLGAGAAFLGLIFVGLSLNLARILAEPNLPRRAEISLILLILQSVVASVALIPGQPVSAAGLEILVAAGAAWLVATSLAIAIKRHAKGPEEQPRRNLAILQAALLPYLAGATLLVAGQPAGLYLVALGLILSFCKAALDAWVLVIEINR